MRRELGMFVALVLMCLGLYLSNPDFLRHSNAVNTTRQIAMLGIYSIGIGFVIITGGIDLSIGSVIGLTGVLIAKASAGPAAFEPTTLSILENLHKLAILLAIALPRRMSIFLWIIYQALFLFGLFARGNWESGVAVELVASAVFLFAYWSTGRNKLLARVALCVSIGRLFVVLNLAFNGGQPIWLAIVIALLVAISIGYLQGLLITRLKLQPFIVTLGGMLLIRGISQTVVEGGTLSIGGSAFSNLADSGLLTWHGDPLLSYPVLIFFAVVAVATYVLHFTVFGRYVYAIGGNRDAADYSGINVKRVETITYVISAGLGGVAGICYAAYIGQMSQQVGIGFELPAIAAVVLGGCSLRGGEGTIFGVVIGSAIMKVIDNGIIMFQLHVGNRLLRLNNNWTFIIIGGVILVAVILDQVVHIVQQKRRVRQAGEIVAERRSFEVVTTAGPGAEK